MLDASVLCRGKSRYQQKMTKLRCSVLDAVLVVPLTKRQNKIKLSLCERNNINNALSIESKFCPQRKSIPTSEIWIYTSV